MEEEQKIAEAPAETAPEPAEEPKETITVSIGDEPAPEPEESEPAPVWIKKVRQRNRELEKELRETRKKLQETSAPKEPEVGAKPTLQGFDYDTDKYEGALATWYERKRKSDDKAAAAREEAAKAEKDWSARLESYQESKASFKADDFDEAESTVLEVMDQTQQGIIVHGATDPTMLVYALGKNESKAKELAAIKDPVKFAFALAKLEATLKVSTKKPATQPESRISGNARPSGTVDSTLERLREEAAKTGDYSKVMKYKHSKQKT
jgi:hypothetical protein